jgi:serine/threonine-protein kinase
MATDAEDIALARHLRQGGLATPEQLAQALQIQAQSVEKGAAIPLAEAFVQIGVLTPAMRGTIEANLKSQKSATQQIGHYRLLKKIGEGGMGAVYLAEDSRNKRRVALKVLPRRHASEPEFMKRFKREAEAAMRLQHPNIVRAYELGDELGYHFYSMEFCEGESLSAALKRQGLLKWRQALAITLQVARGLEHAHGQGIIHRDIKPGNIIVLPDGTAKLLDLGLSKRVDESQLSFQTVTGAVLGTPHYISPEQAKSEKAIDGRTDIYSLGATLYHLLTGEVPFSGDTLYEILNKHVTAELPNPQDLAEEVPDGVVHVPRRMMAKDPANRYADCGTLVRYIELVLAGKEPASQALAPDASSVAVLGKKIQSARRRRAGTYRVPRAARSSASALWGGLAAAGVVFAGALVVLLSGGGTEGPPAVKQTPKSAPSAEEVARKELEGLKGFEGFAADDRQARISRLEAFVAQHPSTAAAKEAREMIDVYRLRLAPAAPAAQGVDLAKGLVGWLKLDEGEGTRAQDSSGLNNHGILIGQVSWAKEAKIGGGARFNGQNGHIEIPTSPSLEDVQEGDYTLAAWFKPEAEIIGPGTADNRSAFALVVNAGRITGLTYAGRFEVLHRPRDSADHLIAVTVQRCPPGAYYHAAGVISRANGTLSIYLDGALSRTGTWPAGAPADEYHQEPWRIGIVKPGAQTFRWAAKGIIDDVRIYNRALSAEEVAALARVEPAAPAAWPAHAPPDAAEFRGHYYKVIDEKVSWADARRRCEELGGHLATIGDEQEQDFLSKLSKLGANLWVGMARGEVKGSWAWVTGEPAAYAAWGPEQPNEKSAAVAVFLRPSHGCRWNDIPLDAANRFVCEWGPFPPVDLLGLIDLARDANSKEGRLKVG